MVVHELGHTAQYERLGGFEPFLRQYLSQCLTIGYPEAPMEQGSHFTYGAHMRFTRIAVADLGIVGAKTDAN